LLDHRKLADVPAVTDLKERSLQGLHRFPHTELLIDFVRKAYETLELLDPTAVRNAVETQLLAPLTDDRLFELVVGFEIIDWLEHAGYRVKSQLVGGAGSVPLATFTGPTPLLLWWQRGLWNTLNGQGGQYLDILNANKMARQQLRPDLVLTTLDQSRILLIEVKQTRVADVSPERRGVLEAMAYLYDAGERFEDLPRPHALVVAWNANAIPGVGAVMVADQFNIPAAMERVVNAWSLPVPASAQAYG
jgi:hypothetical protein